jgi:hypothetical protein
MADVYQFTHPTESTQSSPILYKNTDLEGLDVGSGPVLNITACQNICQKHGKCRAFVYDGEVCWIKSGIPARTIANGFTAGIFPEHYTCSLDEK